jgi:hypothetical protein
MIFLGDARSLARVAGVCAVAALLSACSMGNMFGSGGQGDMAALQNASASQSEIASASVDALPAIATECPPIKVRPGGEALFSYASGRVGEPQDVRFQAIIEKQSRNCVVSNGKISIKMGVVGRLLLGPKGDISSTNLPLRFAIERDGAALFSEKYDIPVSITPPNQSEEFVKVIENVDIPYLGGEQITIWVGFDSRA